MGRLTAMKVKHMAKPGRYSDGDTLILNVTQQGSKNWIQRLTINGRRRDLGLGPFPEISLQEAREKSFENKRAVVHGRNPLADKERDMLTFEQAARKYYEENLPRWKPGRASARWLQLVEGLAFKQIGNIPVDKIDREDVLRVLVPIWTTTPESAKKVRQRIRLILAWCQAHGFTKENPADGRIDGALPRLPSVKAHYRSLPYQDAPDVLEKIEQSKAALSPKLCVQFLILTATRSAEARGAAWTEIDTSKKLWTIPATRTKTKAECRIPLNDQALAVIERAALVRGDNPLIFPSSVKGRKKPMSEITLSTVLKSAGLSESATIHGFRSTFKTWADECTTAPHDIKEVSLGHTIGSAVMQAYSRSDLLEKRRALMQKWSDFLIGHQAKVVNLR